MTEPLAHDVTRWPEPARRAPFRVAFGLAALVLTTDEAPAHESAVR